VLQVVQSAFRDSIEQQHLDHRSLVQGNVKQHHLECLETAISVHLHYSSLTGRPFGTQHHFLLDYSLQFLSLFSVTQCMTWISDLDMSGSLFIGELV
jgi:hypothetical protein